MILPSTRIENCLVDSIKWFEKFDFLQKTDQDKLTEKLNGIPSLKDGEGVKQYIDMKYSEADAKKIRTKATHYLEEKRKEDDREDKKQKDKFGMYILRNHEEEHGKTFKVNNYVENVDFFHSCNPFFYDSSKIFWFWNKKDFRWEIVDEVDLMNSIDVRLGFLGQTVSNVVKSGYLEAFKRIGRMKKPKDAPKEWIQFKDKVYDYKTKKIFSASPDFFVCNPIPWELGESIKTPTMDRLFEEWVGKENIKTLYEIISYCCIIDYPIHLVFCLIGSGRNGKTCFQKLLTKFIGHPNMCSTELDTLLDSRFESAKLFKKLVCSLGETNFGIINKTSLLKKLCGQDLIGYEFKNKKPFDDYNYAKIIISSNSLPTSEDTSEGFYRRWHIIDFPNQFEEGKDIIESIPEKEFKNLAYKCTEFIGVLLKNGSFTNQGSIEERKKKYIMASNPLPFFLENACYRGDGCYVLYSKLFSSYTSFLSKIKRRIITRKEFNQILLGEGLEQRKTTHSRDGEVLSGYFIEGLSLKERWEESIMTFMTNMTKTPLNFPMCKTKVELRHKCHKCPSPKTKVIRRKIQDFLKKGDLEVQYFFDMMEGIGFEKDEISNTIEDGKMKGDWYEKKPNILSKL